MRDRMRTSSSSSTRTSSGTCPGRVPAPVKLVSDVTRDGARPKVARVRDLIATYSQMIGGLRLITRGVAPSVATAVRIEEVEVSSSQQRLATQLSILPLLLVLAALIGGMQIAIDSTAGERERGSLEPLLLNPVPDAGAWPRASGWPRRCSAAVRSSFRCC